jgi:hypothetical protein
MWQWNLDQKEQDKSWLETAKMKCLGKTAKHTPFGHKRNRDILKELETLHGWGGISKCKRKWMQMFVELTDLDFRTAVEKY